jgi:hypothetical protein
MIRGALAIAIALAGALAASAQPAPSAIRGRVGLEDRLEEPSAALAAIDSLRVTPADLPVFVRLRADWTTLQRASTGKWSTLDDRLDAYARRQIPVLIAIGARAGSSEDTTAWVSVVQSVAEHARGRVAGYQIEAASPRPDPRTYAFELKLASVRIRAMASQALIAQATASPADADWLTAVYAEGIAPYVDLAPVAAQLPTGAADRLDALERAIEGGDPSAGRITIGVQVGDAPAESVKRVLTTVLAALGQPGVVGSTFAGRGGALAPALAALVPLKDLLVGDLLPIDDRTIALAIEADGRDVTSRWPHRVLYNVSNGGMYLAYWGADRAVTRVTISLLDQSARKPVLRDPVKREVGSVPAFTWNETTKMSRMTPRVAETPLVLDFNYGVSNTFVSRADVNAARSLSVEEIVALHQQAQAAQANAFRTFIASLRMELHFRPTPAQVFDVVSENRFFFGPDTVEWEELSFSVNGTRWGPDRPGLPLLQAEKVLSLPLDLRLTSDYRYRLERIETIGERACYVLAFEPSDSTLSRYRGWVWIDMVSFLRVKLQSIQTRLEGPIVSNEEITSYAPVTTSGGATVLLPSRQSTKQILLVAGRNLLLEKEQWFGDFRLDPPEFDSERQAARASQHVMFRDTDAGVRYLVKRGEERVVSNDIRTSSKALAMGTIIDPAFAFPLPILGLNYLNFDLKGTGSQLALLYGGVFALGNLQTPKLGKTPFDFSLDFFGIAVPGTDVRFDASGERRDERVLTIPMSTGLNLGYQVSPFQRISAGYILRYDTYFGGPDTAEDFLLPAGTATHGAIAGYEYSRHGYRIGASFSAFVRANWKSWGRPGDFVPDAKTYRRHSISAAKDFLFAPFQSVHVGGAWYGGARLDRFSMYQFGLFDEVRMHGVPSAGIRFRELVLARGSYSFNVLGIYRFDLFLDHARGRDPARREVWRSITGTGAAVTLKAPWNTMFTADFGKSLIPDIYRGTGSMVLQVLVLKPF